MMLTQVQPLNTPTASELTKAREFLCEADILVTDVRALFLNSNDFATAARLKDIQGRLADGIWAVERLVAAATPVYTIEYSVTVLLMCMAGSRRGQSAVKSALSTARNIPRSASLDGASDARATLRPRT